MTHRFNEYHGRRCDLLPDSPAVHELSYHSGGFTFPLQVSREAYDALFAEAVSKAIDEASKVPAFAAALKVAKKSAKKQREVDGKQQDG